MKVSKAFNLGSVFSFMMSFGLLVTIGFCGFDSHAGEASQDLHYREVTPTRRGGWRVDYHYWVGVNAGYKSEACARAAATALSKLFIRDGWPNPESLVVEELAKGQAYDVHIYNEVHASRAIVETRRKGKECRVTRFKLDDGPWQEPLSCATDLGE